MEQETINQRLELTIKELNVSQSAFAKALDISTGRLSNIVKGRNKPDSQLLAKLAEAYPEVNLTWLLTGKNHVQRNLTISRTTKQRKLSKSIVLADPENTQVNTHSAHRLLSNRAEQTIGEQTDKHTSDTVQDVDNETESSKGRVFVSYTHNDLSQLDTLQRLLDLEQKQQSASVQRQLENTLRHLYKVQELIEELLGIPSNEKELRALQHRIFRRPRFSDDDPFDKMSDAEKTAYYAARERLLEHCEAELAHSIDTLHLGIFYGRTGLDKGNPKNGSTGELIAGLLDQRRKTGRSGQILAMIEDMAALSGS